MQCSIVECVTSWQEKNGLTDRDIRFINELWSIVMASTCFKKMANVGIKPTIKCLEDLISKISPVKVLYMLMVGGFARCPELMDALRELCNKNHITLKTPNNISPSLPVVHGAALFGHHSGFQLITNRIQRFSIGIIVAERYSEKLQLRRYCNVHSSQMSSSRYRREKRSHSSHMNK